MRTSRTHPLRIDELRLDGISGAIGLTFCPGKVQSGALTGAWSRDLTADLDVVREWGASAIVNLLESHELEGLRVSHIESAARSVVGDGLTYVHVPIRDVSIPDTRFETAWAETHGPALRGLLRSGRNVLVFCKGGLGRTGTIAARLAVELGCGPHDAIKRVRAVREGAIETAEQEAYVARVAAWPSMAVHAGARPNPGPALSNVPLPPMPLIRDRIEGGLVGLLVGDALGVPYEFHDPRDLPPRERIDMIPPRDFARAHTTALPGTWSDDGAQALCLLETLLERGRFDIDDFAARLLRWLTDGHLAVDAHVFDFGGTTHDALVRLRRGVRAESSGSTDELSNGNGSLMRVLPLALWHRGADEELVELAHSQSLPTHAHARSQVACALYCLVARALLNDEPGPVAWAEQRLRAIYVARVGVKMGQSANEYSRELERILASGLRAQPVGRGYVVDTLWSALGCLDEPTYADVVRAAVALGYDTDTTACVAGGLAGIRFGIEAIPARWREALRGKEILEPLLLRLAATRA